MLRPTGAVRRETRSLDPKFHIDDWYAVGSAEGLPPGGVMPAGVLGVDTVVWRGQSGAVHAWDSRCPHRGMRLSSGFVRGDRLGCLYHGWQYDGDGQCAHIPSHPNEAPPKGVRTEAFAAAEAGGLIWVSVGSSAEPPAETSSETKFCASISLPLPAANLVSALHQGLFVPFGLANRLTSGPAEQIEHQREGDSRTVKWRFGDGQEETVSYVSQSPSASTVTITAQYESRSETVTLAVQPTTDDRSAVHVTATLEENGTAPRLHYARWARRLRWFLENGDSETKCWRPVAAIAGVSP